MTDEEPLTMIVEPYLGIFTVDKQLPDSVVITATCGHQAWMSFPGQMYAAEHGERTINTVCINCVPADKLAELRRDALVVPGSFAEIERAHPVLAKFPGLTQAWGKAHGAREFTEDDVRKAREKGDS